MSDDTTILEDYGVWIILIVVFLLFLLGWFLVTRGHVPSIWQPNTK